MDKKTKVLRLTMGNLKGGVGRSTAAVFTALALAEITNKPVLLVDADPKNGTAYEWREDAGESWPELVKVVNWPFTDLARRVEKEGHTGHIVIDIGNDAPILKQALKATDYLLIPLAPSGTEAPRLTPTLEVAAEVAEDKNLGLGIFLNRVDRRSKRGQQAREALKTQGLPVLDAEVPLLNMYLDAFGTAPRNLGAYLDLVNELLEGAGN